MKTEDLVSSLSTGAASAARSPESKLTVTFCFVPTN
jgi:hypothetical protein